MRLLVNIFMALWVFSTAICGENKTAFVIPSENDVTVYKKMNSTKKGAVVTTVHDNERMKVLSVADKFYKILTSNGLIGWVNKNAVGQVYGKEYSFTDTDIFSHFHDNSPTIIIDASIRDHKIITLERSFNAALIDNVDRETIERLESN